MWTSARNNGRMIHARMRIRFWVRGERKRTEDLPLYTDDRISSANDMSELILPTR